MLSFKEDELRKSCLIKATRRPRKSQQISWGRATQTDESASAKVLGHVGWIFKSEIFTKH